MEERTLPYWQDVKGDADKRLQYHKAHFDKALECLEDLTRCMLEEYKDDRVKSLEVHMVRQMADSMVKCFEQLYCDANQGFPGHKHAIWFKDEDCGNWVYDSRYIYELDGLLKHKEINNIRDLRRYVDEQKEIENLK